MRITAAFLLCCIVAVPAAAPAQVHSATAVKWGPGPAFLPAHARLAVLQGDPGKSGAFTIRLRLPNGYTVRSHFHPTDEQITVLSGTFLVGMGDTFNIRKAERLAAGGFMTVPAEGHHFATARGLTILQIHGEGPFVITYVNTADDPRNAPAKP
jgi:mannose-6-phosphate isomerase-like protein (cupin superfamily)